MLAPSPSDTKKLFNRLYKLAMGTFRCGHHLAEDAASDAICSALEVGRSDYAYCRASMKNYLLVYWRNRKTRNEDYSLPVGEEGEVMEPMSSATSPVQHLRMEAIECALAIENLPESAREAMRYTAKGYSVDEVAEILALSKTEATWRIKYGRKLLRERDGYEIERKRGHHQYIGIRKKHQLWEASIRVADEFHYLGHFRSASDAAKAYDEAAKRLLGDKAKLNFTGTPSRASDRQKGNDDSRSVAAEWGDGLLDADGDTKRLSRLEVGGANPPYRRVVAQQESASQSDAPISFCLHGDVGPPPNQNKGE